MTNDDQQLDENEQSTLNETRDSEDASKDLESLFADSTDDAEAPVSRKEYEDLKKGAQKLATELGRLKKTEPKEAVTGNSVMKNLYFKANPEAELEWGNVEKTAKELGKDPFELYENSAYLKGEAKAKYEAKLEEEKNKSKIAKPSTQTGSSQEDITSTKPEDVGKLTSKQKVEWIEAMAKKERANTD
jgi:hypothetical protein